VESQEEAADDGLVDMGQARPVAYRRLGPAVKKQGNYVPIMIGAALAVILLTWLIATKVLKEDEPPVVAEEKPRDARGGKEAKNIFEFPEGEKAKPKTQDDGMVGTPVAIAPVAAPAVDESPKPVAAVDNDPEKQTDEWKAVVEANSNAGKPGLALWTIVDYRRLHPGKFEAELKQFEDAAFDRLWWERIRDLCEMRDSLAMEIEKKNGEIAQETEKAYKEKLEKEKQLLVFRRQSAMESLTEMGYAAKEPPNSFDAEQIGILRRQRIAETYEGWKRRVTNSLLKTRGLPWERSR
jgi:hypothetical protein